VHWITLKYTTNTMKYTINAPKCIEERFKYFGVFKIHLSLKTHSYVLIYIHIPSKYLTYFYIYYNTITILQYPSLYVEIDLKPLYSEPLCLVTTLFFKTVVTPHYSTKMSYTCHDMFIGIPNEAYSTNPINLN
jgi:hypothetical protein